MKRVLISLILACSSATAAAASPDLAMKWGADATSLYSESVTHLGQVEQNKAPTELSDSFVDRIVRFAIEATRLGKWMDENTDTTDFGCIFRGMAEEADRQLQEIVQSRSPAEQAASLKRIIAMFDDAQTIAVAALEVANTGEASQAPTAHQCLANSVAVDQYFTEQP